MSESTQHSELHNNTRDDPPAQHSPYNAAVSSPERAHSSSSPPAHRSVFVVSVCAGPGFLIADYAVDKAIFIKDVEAYKSMRFESARRKVALLLYQRFVATDEPAAHDFKPGSSVFQIIQARPHNTHG